RHTRSKRDWSSDVCSSYLHTAVLELLEAACAEGCAVVAASHDQGLIVGGGHYRAALGDAPSLSREAWLLGAKEAARITVFVAPAIGRASCRGRGRGRGAGG